MRKELRDAIYGLAVGDALGVPVEFKKRGDFLITGMIGNGTHRQPAGTWSDDTSMTLATADSIREKGKIDTRDMMIRFREWMLSGKYTASGEVFDYGMTTAAAIVEGKPGTGERSNGNGSLMRIIPLAFVPDVTDKEIENVSALTHAHRVSTTACVLYVRIVQEILKGAEIMEAVRNCNPEGKFERLKSIDGMEESEIRSSGYVVDTLEAAIWAVANTKDYKEAVLRAVNLGNDTDTVGAVAGGLAGVIYGMDTIPKEWVEVLKNKPLIDSCLF